MFLLAALFALVVSVLSAPAPAGNLALAARDSEAPACGVTTVYVTVVDTIKSQFLMTVTKTSFLKTTTTDTKTTVGPSSLKSNSSARPSSLEGVSSALGNGLSTGVSITGTRTYTISNTIWTTVTQYDGKVILTPVTTSLASNEGTTTLSRTSTVLTTTTLPDGRVIPTEIPVTEIFVMDKSPQPTSTFDGITKVAVASDVPADLEKLTSSTPATRIITENGETLLVEGTETYELIWAPEPTTQYVFPVTVLPPAPTSTKSVESSESISSMISSNMAVDSSSFSTSASSTEDELTTTLESISESTLTATEFPTSSDEATTTLQSLSEVTVTATEFPTSSDEASSETSTTVFPTLDPTSLPSMFNSTTGQMGWNTSVGFSTSQNAGQTGSPSSTETTDLFSLTSDFSSSTATSDVTASSGEGATSTSSFDNGFSTDSSFSTEAAISSTSSDAQESTFSVSATATSLDEVSTQETGAIETSESSTDADTTSLPISTEESATSTAAESSGSTSVTDASSMKTYPGVAYGISSETKFSHTISEIPFPTEFSLISATEESEATITPVATLSLPFPQDPRSPSFTTVIVNRTSTTESHTRHADGSFPSFFLPFPVVPVEETRTESGVTFTTSFYSTQSDSFTGWPIFSMATEFPTATEDINAPAATPTSCGEIGKFNLTFDEFPALVGDDSTPPLPFFGAYKYFDFNGRFSVGPPPRIPFVPESAPLVLQFNATTSIADGFVARGEIGPSTGNQGLGCFNFDAQGVSIGCDSLVGNCEWTIVGVRYNSNTGNYDEVITQSATTPPCPADTGCDLTEVVLLDGFRNLNSIRVTATVGGEPRDWWMDNILLSWADNSCQAGLCRSEDGVRGSRR